MASISSAFNCSITHDFAYDPSICSCTVPHLFDEQAFSKWLNLNPVCPITRSPCDAPNIDADAVEAAFPGVFQFLLDNNINRPFVPEEEEIVPVGFGAGNYFVIDDYTTPPSSDDDNSDDDDFAQHPTTSVVHLASVYTGSLLPMPSNVQIYQPPRVHDNSGPAAPLLFSTVTDFNSAYLFNHALYHVPVLLHTYRMSVGNRSSRASLRYLRNRGVFVHTYARQGTNFVFDALPLTIGGINIRLVDSNIQQM
jgi:hypothetical protein